MSFGLYLIERYSAPPIGDYRQILVVAESEEAARRTHPNGYTYSPEGWRRSDGSISGVFDYWAPVSEVDFFDVTLIGYALPSATPGVILRISA